MRGRPFRDLTGKRFGDLYVIRRVKNNKSNHAQFLTRCEVEGCGNEKVLRGDRLTRKTYPMTHCGCLSFQHRSDALKGNTSKPFRDLTDQTFGDLYVIKRVENNKWDQVQFLTRCEVEGCGNEKVMSGNRLTSKKQPTTHCGCLTFQHNSDAQKGNTKGITHGLSKTPEYWAERGAKRRIKKQNNNLTFNLSYAESFAMPRLELDYCVYCGSTENLATDHIIPIDKGGTQDPKNLIRACKSCNSAKRNLFFIDWYLKTDRVKRKLDDIIKDMGFDSIHHLQNYQDSLCPEHIEKDPNVRFHKLVKADMKDINKIIDLL